jgi:cytochrome o ubiquinol oxidase subunit 2
MSNKRSNIKIVALILAPIIVIIGLLVWYLNTHTVAVLAPAGQVAQKERQLILVAGLLSVFVVLPVYTMTVMIAWKYRAGNKKAKYSPDWDHSRVFESIWWGIPIVIISILSVITWRSSHQLDPYKTIASNIKPVSVQVVALDWKWLFIYPQYHVASVNMLEFPKNTPVDFYITSDTVMNSFWIPRLGGQIYAMPGMMTELHLIASENGSYAGSSANISGVGFANMTFTAKATTQSDFNNWVTQASNAPTMLNNSTYAKLSAPTNGSPVEYYSNPDPYLFNNIINKYMSPTGGRENQYNSPATTNMNMDSN